MATFTLPTSKNIWNFDPTSIGGCTLWLDGADSNTILATAGGAPAVPGGSVQQWRDKSIMANHASQATTGNRPTRDAINGLAFTGSNSQFLQLANAGATYLPTGATNGTYFTVSKLNPDLNTACGIISHGSTGVSSSRTVYDRILVSASEVTPIMGAVISQGLVSSVPNPFSINQFGVPSVVSPHIITLSVNNFIGSVWISGTPAVTTNVDLQTAATVINTGTTVAYIGRSILTTGFEHYTGNICEVLVFNTTLSNIDRQIIEGYLAYKWNLIDSLPTTHPYYNNRIRHSFIPPAMSYCSLWLDAADRSTLYQDTAFSTLAGNEDNIGGWLDKSGFGNYAYSVGSFRPLLTSNVLRFSGDNFMTMLPSGIIRLPINTRAGTYFVISNTRQSTETTTPQVVFSYGTTEGVKRSRIRQMFYADGANGTPAGTKSFAFDTYQSNRVFDATDLRDQLSMITATQNTTSTAGWLNGNLFSGGSAPDNGSGLEDLQVGTITSGTRFGFVGAGVNDSDVTTHLLVGDIGEILVFNAVLPTTHRENIEGYLAWKWGLQSLLPATHSYTLANYFYNNTRPFLRNFVPTDISNCVMWFDGADLTTMFTNTAGTTQVTGTGSLVRFWRDKSNTGNNLTSVSDTNSPTITTSSDPRGFDLVFDGNDYLSKTDVVNNSNTYTKFLVFKRNDTGTNTNQFQRVFSYGTTSGDFSAADPTGFHFQSATTQTAYVGYKSNISSGDLSLALNTYHIVTIVASPLTMSIFSNGSLTPAVTVSAIPNTNFNATTFRLGTNFIPGSNSYWPGVINEVISYNRQLSVTEYRQVEGYLAWKWGLRNSLPATHPFYKFPNPSLTPLQPELQLYKNTFDPSDLNPVIWIDPKDNTTITKNATTSRITAIVNKGSYSATFTPPTAGTGTGISGPLVTTATTGSSLGQQFLDFSNGGNYQVTSVTVGASPFTQLTLTVSPPHNGEIPVGAFVNFTAHNGAYPGGSSATRTIGPFQILSATVTGGTTLTITTIPGHGIGNSESIFLTINTGTFLGGALNASSLTGPYTTAAAGNTGSTIVIPIAPSTNGIMAITDGHVRNNVGTTGPYITQAGTTGSTVILTSYSPRVSAGTISHFTGRIEYGQIPFTSAILTSTTSMTLRTPINHGLSSGTQVGISMNNVGTMPFQVTLPTTGTTLGAASVQFTSATVSAGGTTLTITVTTNPFFIKSATPNYVGLSPIRLTLLAGTNFNNNASATGISTTGLVTQAGSNATTIVLTIPSSPPNALKFTALPGILISDQTTGSNSFRLNSTQTLSAGTSGNTIVIPVPLYTSAIPGRIVDRTAPSWNSNIQNVSLLFPLNGRAIELTSMGSALTTNRATIIWVSCLANNLSRNNPISSSSQSPVLSTSVSLNGDAGADTVNGGRDYKLIIASYAGNASRLGFAHGLASGTFFLGTFTDGVTQFRVNSAVINLTATAVGDVGPNLFGVSTFGWRYNNQFRNTSYSVEIGGRRTTNLAPTHLRIGANTNATTNYTTHPLTGQWYEGGIGDILIFNSILATEQRQLVEGYLAQKYTCQTYLGLTSTTSNTTATYSIASASVSGSGPYTISLNGTFTTAFINGSQITISGATPTGLNNTWTLTLASTTQVQFYSDVSYTWSSGGSILGIITVNANFIHPYRANLALISPSLNLTQLFSQGLATWFDAANSSTIRFSSGNLVNSWTSSGGNLPLTLIPDGTNYPTLVQEAQNGLPGVRFATSGTPLGTSFIYPISSFSTVSTNNEFTIITVYKQATFTSSRVISNIIGSSDNPRLMAQTDSFSYRNTTTEQTKAYTANIDEQAYISVYYRRGVTLFIRDNGLIDTGGTTSGTNLSIPSSLGSIFGLTLGAYAVTSPASNAFVGDIYEHIIFRYALTDQEIFPIEGYLAWKWGLQRSLPTTHPYYKIRP